MVIEDMLKFDDFDAQTCLLLRSAFEKARKSLHDKGQPPLVRQVIAERIIAAAKLGERDPDRLCESALRALGSKAVFER
jgi:hypothetical protein